MPSLLRVVLFLMPLTTTQAFTSPSSSTSTRQILQAHSSRREPRSSSDNARRPVWRRAFRKVLKRRERSSTDSVFQVSQKDDAPQKASTRMQMSSFTDMAETDLGTILDDFELLTPSDVFPNLTMDEISVPYMGTMGDLELFLDGTVNPLLLDESEDELLIDDDLEATLPANKVDRATVMNRLFKHWFEGMLRDLVHRRSIQPPQGLKVSVEPQANKMLRGKVQTDAEVSFGKLVTAPIQLSGGSVQAKRLAMNLWSFTPDLMRQGAARRYAQQFDFHFNDCIFTEDDLIQSRSIRNGLQRLLARVLTRAGVSTNHVTVKSIRLLRNGKVACKGEAGTTFGGQIPFEVRSRLDLASRGHVLTFPGLEVSLQPSLGLFVPVLPEIDLDMGHNARLLSVDIASKKLAISAKVTVTPEHTLKLKEYLQTKESYSAHFSFDVGRWLTKAGNFTR